MSAPKPPRGPIIEENAARGPHTPIPHADLGITEPPPAPMRMAPPRGYDAPRPRMADRRDPDRTLQGLAPPSEKRPPVANPPPPESIRPPMRSVSDEVQANYGKGRFAGPAWAFLVACALAAAVAVTYFVTRNSDGSRPPNDDVLTAVNRVEAKFDKSEAAHELHDALMLQRIGALETQNGATQARLDAVLASQGRGAQPVSVQMSNALNQK